MSAGDLERMRRARARSNAKFATLAAIVILLNVCGVVWLLLHPEAIGAFVGRILSGARGVR